VRAGVSGFQQHPFLIDTAGKPPVVAIAPYLSVDLCGAPRLAELAGPAAAQAMQVLDRGTRVHLFIGLPPERPGRPSDLTGVAQRVADEAERGGCLIAGVTTNECGHAAGMIAIHEAWQAIRSEKAEFALAGGVESYLEPETLEWLESNDQVHSAGPHNNPYGFVPGEAGAFVLLTAADTARRRSLGAAIGLPVISSARETKLIKTEAICTGEGLTSLFRQLTAGIEDGARANGLFCDLNGEPYRSDEFGFATIRAGTLFVDASAFTAPADCCGDVGAASGPLYLVLVDAAARKRYLPGPIVAAYASAESGERCGFVARLLG
jgi:3-oxoacyl-[acyl-carrier-protein] synthase-1